MTPPELPQYEVIREPGRGGMGVVYLAHHTLLGLVKGYEGMKAREKTPGADAARLALQQRLAEALDRVVELYTAADKPDEARKWQQLRAEYPAGRLPDPKPPEPKK